MSIALLVKSGGFQGFLNIITLILIFVLVLFLAYYTTKFVAKYQKNTLSNRSNIQVIESFRIGNNKYIAIVKIAETYYAIGVGKEEITYIDRLDSEKIKTEESGDDSSAKKIDFKDLLSQIRNKESKDKNEK